MKKLVTLLMVVVMVFTGLVGCGNSVEIDDQYDVYTEEEEKAFEEYAKEEAEAFENGELDEEAELELVCLDDMTEAEITEAVISYLKFDFGVNAGIPESDGHVNYGNTIFIQGLNILILPKEDSIIISTVSGSETYSQMDIDMAYAIFWGMLEKFFYADDMDTVVADLSKQQMEGKPYARYEGNYNYTIMTNNSEVSITISGF